MALKCVLVLALISTLILFGECAPRLGREDNTVSANGSGDADMTEYGNEGAADPDDDDEDYMYHPTGRSNPEYDEDNDYNENENEIDQKKPTPTPTSAGKDDVDEDEDDAYEEEIYLDEYDDDEGTEDTNNAGEENSFVSINNNNAGTGRVEEPPKDKDHKTEDKDSNNTVGEDDSTRATTDDFFELPDTVTPDSATDKHKDPKVDHTSGDKGPTGTTNERDNFFDVPNTVTPDSATDKHKDPKIDHPSGDKGPSGTTNERDNFFGLPAIATDKHKDPKILDEDDYAAVEKDNRPSVTTNERDNFFGKTDTGTPDSNSDFGVIGLGIKRTDVMIVFDEDAAYDDSHTTEDPVVVNLKKGDYVRDDFFDTIGMKKLDDFIPKATEIKLAADFIEGNSATLDDNMDDIFGVKFKKAHLTRNDAVGKIMKDDFFDSIAVKNIVKREGGFQLHTNQSVETVYSGVHGVVSELSIAEEQKMKKLIASVIELFRSSPCQKGGRGRKIEKCVVLGDLIEALTLLGLTFNTEIMAESRSSYAKPAKKRWGAAPHVIFG